MKVYIAFLLITFILAGRSGGPHRMLRRPILLLALSVVVAASFYSMRVLQ